jgi:hypothetical protein
MAGSQLDYAADLQQSFNRSMSFGGNPAMTSSQQELRNWQQPNVMPPSTGWTVSRDNAYPDDRFSDRESVVANPLDERFSEPESSVAGEAPFDPRNGQGVQWRPQLQPVNGVVPNGSVHGMQHLEKQLKLLFNSLFFTLMIK